MDVIFYFAISLLIATVFLYIIFIVKNGIQRKDIKEQEVKLETVGTEQDKDYDAFLAALELRRRLRELEVPYVKKS